MGPEASRGFFPNTDDDLEVLVATAPSNSLAAPGYAEELHATSLAEDSTPVTPASRMSVAPSPRFGTAKLSYWADSMAYWEGDPRYHVGVFTFTPSLENSPALDILQKKLFYALAPPRLTRQDYDLLCNTEAAHEFVQPGYTGVELRVFVEGFPSNSSAISVSVPLKLLADGDQVGERIRDIVQKHYFDMTIKHPHRAPKLYHGEAQELGKHMSYEHRG